MLRAFGAPFLPFLKGRLFPIGFSLPLVFWLRLLRLRDLCSRLGPPPRSLPLWNFALPTRFGCRLGFSPSIASALPRSLGASLLLPLPLLSPLGPLRCLALAMRFGSRLRRSIGVSSMLSLANVGPFTAGVPLAFVGVWGASPPFTASVIPLGAPSGRSGGLPLRGCCATSWLQCSAPLLRGPFSWPPFRLIGTAGPIRGTTPFLASTLRPGGASLRDLGICPPLPLG